VRSIGSAGPEMPAVGLSDWLIGTKPIRNVSRRRRGALMCADTSISAGDGPVDLRTQPQRPARLHSLAPDDSHDLS
jgi:hypothetical protein